MPVTKLGLLPVMFPVKPLGEAGLSLTRLFVLVPRLGAVPES